MLLVFGWIFTVLAILSQVMLMFADMMSVTGEERTSKWPALALALAALVCFVLHHYFHGHPLTL